MRTLRRAIGGLLAISGLAAVCWSGLALMEVEHLRVELRQTLPVVQLAPERGRPLGMIEIPRLRLSSVVVEGDDETSLLVAAGHLPDTPLPWQPGNSVLAGHRDTDFGPLQGIKPGDVIRFVTADSTFEYTVRDTKVVAPTDLSVLEPTRESTLTLVTCYPFRYIGPAPRRFVVRAERASAIREVRAGPPTAHSPSGHFVPAVRPPSPYDSQVSGSRTLTPFRR